MERKQRKWKFNSEAILMFRSSWWQMCMPRWNKGTKGWRKRDSNLNCINYLFYFWCGCTFSKHFKLFSIWTEQKRGKWKGNGLNPLTLSELRHAPRLDRTDRKKQSKSPWCHQCPRSWRLSGEMENPISPPLEINR